MANTSIDFIPELNKEAKNNHQQNQEQKKLQEIRNTRPQTWHSYVSCLHCQENKHTTKKIKKQM